MVRETWPLFIVAVNSLCLFKCVTIAEKYRHVQNVHISMTISIFHCNSLFFTSGIWLAWYDGGVIYSSSWANDALGMDLLPCSTRQIAATVIFDNTNHLLSRWIGFSYFWTGNISAVPIDSTWMLQEGSQSGELPFSFGTLCYDEDMDWKRKFASIHMSSC